MGDELGNASRCGGNPTLAVLHFGGNTNDHPESRLSCETQNETKQQWLIRATPFRLAAKRALAAESMQEKWRDPP
jgi:hypothetical protein